MYRTLGPDGNRKQSLLQMNVVVCLLPILALVIGCLLCLHSIYLVLYRHHRVTFGADEKQILPTPTNLPNNTKIVLLWTPFFGNQRWPDHFERNHGPFVHLFADDSNSNSTIRHCYFTTNHSYLTFSSAIILHGRDINLETIGPPIRLPWQRYVFYLLESPMNTFYTPEHWEKINSLEFNWVMSYSPTLSDIYAPYGVLRRSNQPANVAEIEQKVNKFLKSFKSRPVDAVWIVSNCLSSSQRHLFAAKLTEYGIKVDIWGACSGHSPDEIWNRDGQKAFFSKYRFVFGFENSLCEDYVTEKAFLAFYANFIAGSIPVLYGAGNYSKFFPSGSYIDVRAYDKITDLVTLMKNLSNSGENSPALHRYYEWQTTINPVYEHGYEIENESDIYIHDNAKAFGWQNLCKRLWKENYDRESTKHIPANDNIEARLGQCFPALSRLPQLGIENIFDHDFLANVFYKRYYNVSTGRFVFSNNS